MLAHAGLLGYGSAREPSPSRRQDQGPQVEVEASAGTTGRGWLRQKQRLLPHEHFRNGQWNRYRVVAKGPRIRT
jgi:hypothetical protein